MSPSERCAAAVKLLAEINQVIAKCEDLESEPILSCDEVDYLAAQLNFSALGPEVRREDHRITMSTTPDSDVAKLLRIAEAVALEECEAVEHGQEPCPVQCDDQEEWCLPCLAKEAAGEYTSS